MLSPHHYVLQNIWEVGSTGSACSLDDELTRELEELDRKEEEEQHIIGTNGTTSNGLRASVPADGSGSGSTADKTEDSPAKADGGDSFQQKDENDDFEEETGIVFKNTGVISVADCNELSDAYKAKVSYLRATKFWLRITL